MEIIWAPTILLLTTSVFAIENLETLDVLDDFPKYDLSTLDTNFGPDESLDFLDLAAKYGFPNAEERNVETEDGFILGLYHIPGNPQQPVLLVHGNTADSISWIQRGNTSLAITLARRGYDVWAINLRGTSRSRRNLCIDVHTQERQFYNYSFYEQGIYDVPATIDFILEETNQTELLAIGSEKPEYNDKIKLFISLAPISYLQHMRGTTKLFMGPDTLTTILAKFCGVSEVDGESQPTSRLAEKICLGPFGYEKCVYGYIFPTFGFDPPGFERGFHRTYFKHFTEGTSVKLFAHTLQVAERNKFAKFDYGVERNLVEYGTEEPPEFDLSKVTMKMALFVGREDYLASVPDAERLRCALPNVVHYQVLPYEFFNHLDFIVGRYMPTNLYPYLLPLVDKFID